MIKAIVCIKRKAGMEVEAFQEYWRTRHAEVVSELPGVRRYVQSHARLSGYRVRDLADSKEYAAVEADEANFIDPANRVFFLADEHVIKDGPAPEGGVKNIEFINRRPGMSVEDFQNYWRDVHGPLAAKIEVIERYVQNHVRLGGYKDGRQPTYDGLAITWFESTDAMRVSATTEEYEVTRADEPSFLPAGEIPIIITEEHVII